AFAGLLVVLSAGIVVLGASAWRVGVFVVAAATFYGFVETRGDGPGYVAAHAVAMLATFWLWGEGARRAVHPLARAYYALVAAASAVASLAYWGGTFEERVAWPGLSMVGVAAAFAAAGVGFLALLQLPCFARRREPDDAATPAPWLRWASPALASAALCF